MKRKTALVTGGAGFIGSHLVDLLLHHGYEVFVLDDLSTGSVDNIHHLLNHPSLHFYVDSILNKDLLAKLIPQVDEIYHLAAAVGVKYVIDNPLKSLEVNVVGSHNIFELANHFHKPPIFLASTSEIYGKNNDNPLVEGYDRVLGCTSISRWGYSTSKAMDEFLAMAYFREKKLPIVIGRFFNTSGPRQTGSYGMVIPRFVKQALQGKPLTIFGDGSQSRCFSYVGDVVGAVYSLMQTPDAVGEVFNIGNNQEITIKDLALRIKEMTESDSEVHYIPYDEAYENGFEDMQRRIPDLSKISKWINYAPSKDTDDIIREVMHFLTR